MRANRPLSSTVHLGLLCAVLAAVLACSLPSASQPASPPPATEPAQGPTATPDPSQHRIGIRTVDGAVEFFDKTTGQKFTPRGVNLINLKPAQNGSLQDRSFAVGVYDHDELAGIFARLHERGFNTVRMFVDTCQGGDECLTRPGKPGLNPEVLDNIADATQLARDQDIVLLLTSNDIPDDGGYGARANQGSNDQFAGYRNAHMLTTPGVSAATSYWRDLVTGLIDHHVALEGVLGWQLLNEQWLFEEQPPLSLASGSVTTANGETYDMSSLDAKHQMVADGVTHYIHKVGEVIREVDPTALVTMGFFMPAFPDGTTISPGWYVDTKPLLATAELDFYDLHAYPGGISVEDHAANFGVLDFKQKPFIMGEVGAFAHTYSTPGNAAPAVQKWIADSCAHGFDGWLYWAYRTPPPGVGDATWSFEDEDGLLVEALAPDVQPDPCQPTLAKTSNLALGAQVRASASAQSPAEGAVDGTSNAFWGAGSGPPQWIEVDLGQAYDIAKIRLQVGQYPGGETVHRVLVRGAGQDFVEVHQFAGLTNDSDWLEFIPDQPLIAIQVVRIETVSSPSWVAWKEIEIIAVP